MYNHYIDITTRPVVSFVQDMGWSVSFGKLLVDIRYTMGLIHTLVPMLPPFIGETFTPTDGKDLGKMLSAVNQLIDACGANADRFLRLRTEQRKLRIISKTLSHLITSKLSVN